jgi:putative pyruvate formate lyase activating enzyme
MHRQVGDLKTDLNNIAMRGMIIRHLVMPGASDDSREILNFISRCISSDSYVNIMKQFRPCYRSDQFPEINRRVSDGEFRAVLKVAESAGL